MGKSKQLTFSAMKKVDKEYDKKIVVPFGDKEVKIDEKFRPSKVQVMIEEVMDAFQVLKDLGHIEFIGRILPFYIIKHFSNIPDLPTEFEEQLLCMDVMIDIGLFEVLWNSFDGEEIEKVMAQFKKTAKVYPSLLAQIAESMSAGELGDANI